MDQERGRSVKVHMTRLTQVEGDVFAVLPRLPADHHGARPRREHTTSMLQSVRRQAVTRRRSYESPTGGDPHV